jgi:uncharacterized protein YfiM (DUF2279 family)
MKAVKDMWNQKKHISGYKFKDALRDAKKIYQGSSSSSGSSSKTSKYKKSRKSRRSRRSRKTRKH